MTPIKPFDNMNKEFVSKINHIYYELSPKSNIYAPCKMLLVVNVASFFPGVSFCWSTGRRSCKNGHAKFSGSQHCIPNCSCQFNLLSTQLFSRYSWLRNLFSYLQFFFSTIMCCRVLGDCYAILESIQLSFGLRSARLVEQQSMGFTL